MHELRDKFIKWLGGYSESQYKEIESRLNKTFEAKSDEIQKNALLLDQIEHMESKIIELKKIIDYDATKPPSEDLKPIALSQMPWSRMRRQFEQRDAALARKMDEEAKTSKT